MRSYLHKVAIESVEVKFQVREFSDDDMAVVREDEVEHDIIGISGMLKDEQGANHEIAEFKVLAM